MDSNADMTPDRLLQTGHLSAAVSVNFQMILGRFRYGSGHGLEKRPSRGLVEYR